VRAVARARRRDVCEHFVAVPGSGRGCERIGQRSCAGNRGERPGDNGKGSASLQKVASLHAASFYRYRAASGFKRGATRASGFAVSVPRDPVEALVARRKQKSIIQNVRKRTIVNNVSSASTDGTTNR
jgi:hypothetical protein